MSRRDDLLHLTPEALAQAANTGIVKRAVRELAAGDRPAVAVDEAGLLTATFADGVAVRWPAGVPIQQAACTCGAAAVCRHRVVAVLAWREAASADAAPPEARPVEEADDTLLARVVPAPLHAVASALRDAGVAAEVRRRGGGEPCDTVRLPSATVRYWAGAAIEAARCDCVRAAACEHVLLGVWAFRAAARGAAVSQVRLGGAGTLHTVDRAPFEALAEAIVRHGVARGPDALMQALSTARDAAHGQAWTTLLVADLEAWCGAYAARSALYDAGQGADLLGELALRLAAGGQAGQAGPVLGTGQPGDTELDRLRLMCLGARTVRDGTARRTTLVMADIDTGTRLALAHEWTVPEGREAGEAALRASERVAPGVNLEALGQGQLLAQRASRRADGSVRLARARASLNSVLPQKGDWQGLGPPLRFDRVAALAREHRTHPNPALHARHAARRHVVFTPAVVDDVVYDAVEQEVACTLRDADGEPLLLRRTHERHVSHALDAVAAALRGRHGPLRHVAGVLSWERGVPCLEPWALSCDHLVVPDFARGTGELASVPAGAVRAGAGDPVADAVGALRDHLSVLLHHGLGLLPRSWDADGQRLAGRLAQVGLHALASHLSAFLPGVAAAKARPGDEGLGAALLPLLALRALHEDAMALGDGDG